MAEPARATSGRRRFSRSYLVVTSGFGFRALLLSVLVVLLARALGPSDFGGYAAAASLASFFSMFSGMGAGPLHVRDVARGTRRYESSVNHTIHRVAWTFLPLTLIAMLCAWWVVPHSVQPAAIIAIVLGETMNYVGSDLAVRILQARERYTAMTLALCATPFTRVVAALAMTAAGWLSLWTWALVSAATGAALCAAIACIWVWRMRGHLGSRIALFQDSMAGMGFAMAAAASRVHGDADKVILVRLASTATAGTYTIAYRLADVLLLPINAGVERLLPILFKQGARGLRQSLRASAAKVGMVLAFAVVLSGGVYVLAPLLPWVLGHDYAESVSIARALAAVPFTTACWVVLRTLAATAGYERSTGWFELAGALFNVVITIALVMAWNWRGAVAATYITQIAMVAAFSLYAWLGAGADPRASAVPDAAASARPRAHGAAGSGNGAA